VSPAFRVIPPIVIPIKRLIALLAERPIALQLFIPSPLVAGSEDGFGELLRDLAKLDARKQRFPK
jgi:hypothetical protein